MGGRTFHVVLCFLLIPWVNGMSKATLPARPRLPRIPVLSDAPVVSRNGTKLPPYNTTYYFDQLIDHNDPSLGTFKQRYWHTYEYFEPGGPVIVMNGGEANAEGSEGYLTNRTFNGQLAQQQNGTVVMIEHRFFGLSNPCDNLNETSLRLLTIQQSIDDMEYFAKNVKLPMPGGDELTPDKAPWIMVGGSYSGALTGWTMVNKPGLFWAGYASSAVVQAISNFWAYFDPIRQYMPQNCSTDVQAVVSHIDDVLTSGHNETITNIKNMFGLGALTHLDDVAGALVNNLDEWQDLSPETGAGNGSFFKFCDALEVKDGVTASAPGWGLDHALTAWGNYWTEGGYLNSLCNDVDVETCLGTYNSSQSNWTDTTVDNDNRSWTWITCNELGYWQDGAPEGVPSIVTRLVGPEYFERQCTYWFPETFPKAPSPRTEATNLEYNGWFMDVDRLFFANGKRDPWRDATVSSDFMPRMSTPWQPIAVGDGYHCSDLITKAGLVDDTVLDVQKQGLEYMKTWLEDWRASRA